MLSFLLEGIVEHADRSIWTVCHCRFGRLCPGLVSTYLCRAVHPQRPLCLGHKIKPMNSEIRELDRQIAELQARRDKLVKENKSQAIETVRKLVQEFGLTPSQIGLSSMSRNPLPPSTKRPTTFYDPNRGLSWDGSLTSRGRKPAWIVQAINDKTIEFFRVQVQSAQQ